MFMSSWSTPTYQFVTFSHHEDARDGQRARITNVLRGIDGPCVYWLEFADGSTYRANYAHIYA